MSFGSKLMIYDLRMFSRDLALNLIFFVKIFFLINLILFRCIYYEKLSFTLLNLIKKFPPTFLQLIRSFCPHRIKNETPSQNFEVHLKSFNGALPNSQFRFFKGLPYKQFA